LRGRGATGTGSVWFLHEWVPASGGLAPHLRDVDGNFISVQTDGAQAGWVARGAAVRIVETAPGREDASRGGA
jgi:hypothetical protein